MKPVTIHPPKEVKKLNASTRLVAAFGILSSAIYLAANIICVLQYKGYSAVSQTVSELSAIDAPTRPLWDVFMVPYALLTFAFGCGLSYPGIPNRPLRRLGFLFILYALIGFLWPPMHQREVLVEGRASLTDMLHIAFTLFTGPLILMIVGVGAAAFGKQFRLYSIITLVTIVVAGIFTAIEAPNISTGRPTPHIGIWERVNIGAFIIWVMVLAGRLVQKRGT